MHFKIKVHINKHVAGQAGHNDNIHEHYCGFISVVLKGSYVQEIDRVNGKGRIIEQVKWFNWMPRHYRHRIIHTNNKPCWSIMVKNPFKKFRTFNFILPCLLNFALKYLCFRTTSIADKSNFLIFNFIAIVEMKI